MSNVLITGCSTGFGFETVKAMVAKGHTVFATMRAVADRNAEKAAKLKSACEGASGDLHVLDLDVTDQASVDAAVGSALKTAGHLDAVINNAGFGGSGYMETFTPEQFQAVFDVNVFGVHRVNRAVLPSMRARKQGLLVHVSSTIGRIVFPYFSSYGPSKYAIESMAEGLSYELKPTGVDVAIVQLGGFVTSFLQNMQAPGDTDRIATYGELADLPGKMWAAMAESGGLSEDLTPVTDAFIGLVEMPAGERPLRTLVDPQTGEPMKALNAAHDGVQKALFAAWGMG